MSWLLLGNLIDLVVGTIAGWSFLVLYTKRYDWYRDEVGRHLVAFSGVATLFYTLYLGRTVAAIFTTGFNAPGEAVTGFNIFRFFLFTAFTIVMVWRLVIFIKGTHRTDHLPVRRQPDLDST
jgi:hypothetical protein